MKFQDERGQVLLLALGFLVFCGLVIGALATFAGASVLSSERLRDQRATVYAADGAMDAAIQAGRQNQSIGAFGAIPCMITTSFTVTATTTDAKTASVTCESIGDAIDQDRTVRFTATVASVKTIVATVIYHDAVGSVPEVTGWSYCQHDAGACT